MMAESTLLGALSLLQWLPKTGLIFYFYTKAAIGLFIALGALNKAKNSITSSQKARQTLLPNNSNLHLWMISLWGTILILNASIPTSSFDNFSAHFPIPNLFIDASGYPNRPDFQYLDALPLGAHMWLIPPFAAQLEGGANIISGIFSLATLLLIANIYGPKICLWSSIAFLSMPEFIRVSLDPMMDTPCFFYAISGWYLLSQQHLSRQLMGFSFLCFLCAIKPTLVGFPMIACCWIIVRNFKKINLSKLSIAIALTLPGALWYIKNAIFHGNPLYPHVFSSAAAPFCPPEYLPMVAQSQAERIWNYMEVLFAEPHYNLSYGFWILYGLPLVFQLRKSKHRWALSLIALGVIITYLTTPFKNRYMMPYIMILIPTLGILAHKSQGIIKALLLGTVFINLISVAPYTAQPLLATIKNWNYDDYYRFKFYNYATYEKVNQLPEGKILLTGQPSHWIKRPHLLSVISETHLDYTRLESIDELITFIRNNNLSFLVFDQADTQGMAQHPKPWYRKKSYCAKRALHWVEKLSKHPQTQLILEENGVQVLDTRPLLNHKKL
jgi:hypothetical protein